MLKPMVDTPDRTHDMPSSQMPPMEMDRAPGFLSRWKYPAGNAFPPPEMAVESRRSAAEMRMAPPLCSLKYPSTLPNWLRRAMDAPGSNNTPAGGFRGSATA